MPHIGSSTGKSFHEVFAKQTRKGRSNHKPMEAELAAQATRAMVGGIPAIAKGSTQSLIQAMP